MVSQLCLMCGSTLNCQTLCLGARSRYSLVVDEDVRRPTNQPTNCIDHHGRVSLRCAADRGQRLPGLYLTVVVLVVAKEDNYTVSATCLYEEWGGGGG